MYQAGMRQSRLKCCLTMFFCIIGPMFFFMGIMFVAIIGRDSESQGSTIAGSIIIAVSSIFIIISIGLCISMKMNANSANNTNNGGLVLSGQPVVSGSAPPGPIGGFHITQQQQQGFIQPSAPPNWSDTAAAPPSYYDATKTPQY